MGIIFMKHGRKSKDWRKSIRTLRRLIEVSQGVHSIYDVRHYIKQPHQFFNEIRNELDYLSNTKQEFLEIVESAEVWYLAYLHEIEQNAKEFEVEDDQDEHIEISADESSANVIPLFKSAPKQSQPEQEESNQTLNNAEDIDLNNDQNELNLEENINSGLIHSQAPDDIKVEEIYDEQASFNEENHEQDEAVPPKIDVTSEPEIILEPVVEPEPEPESEPEKIANEIEQEENIDEEEPEEAIIQATLADIPKEILPGAWLEIYQGVGKAKRRLKLSAILEDTGCLLFTDRSGDLILEIDIQTFMDDLNSERTILISESNRFDLALSSVISNIRDSQNKSPGSN